MILLQLVSDNRAHTLGQLEKHIRSALGSRLTPHSRNDLPLFPRAHIYDHLEVYLCDSTVLCKER